MLYRLCTNAAGLAAYFEVMGNDPCGYLGETTARNCARLARALHSVAHATDVLEVKLSAVRRALRRPFMRWQVRAA